MRLMIALPDVVISGGFISYLNTHDDTFIDLYFLSTTGSLIVNSQWVYTFINNIIIIFLNQLFGLSFAFSQNAGFQCKYKY